MLVTVPVGTEDRWVGQEGKLTEALEDTAAYVRERQSIDAENLRKLQEGLAKSRAKLLADLDDVLGRQDVGLEKALTQVQSAGESHPSRLFEYFFAVVCLGAVRG
jgi:hypothetical protein